MSGHDHDQADQAPLRELFGVRHRDGGSVTGPPERDRCEALVEQDPNLVVVHYFSTDWTVVSS